MLSVPQKAAVVREGAAQQAATALAQATVEVTGFAYGSFAIAPGCAHLSQVLLIMELISAVTTG